MKLNNKGYLLIEIVLASTLAFIIAYFLMDITIKVVNKNHDKTIESIILTDKAIITKEIMNDVNNKKITDIQKNSEFSVTIYFDGEEPKNIELKEGKIIYGDFSKKINESIEVGEFDYKEDSNGNIRLSIPMKTKYSDEDFGLNIIIPIGRKPGDFSYAGSDFSDNSGPSNSTDEDTSLTTISITGKCGSGYCNSIGSLSGLTSGNTEKIDFNAITDSADIYEKPLNCSFTNTLGNSVSVNYDYDCNKIMMPDRYGYNCVIDVTVPTENVTMECAFPDV